MSRCIMLAPAGENVGLTTISLGLLRAFQQRAIPVKLFKPISDAPDVVRQADASITIARNACDLHPAEPLSSRHVESMISANKTEELLEEIVALFEQHHGPNDVVLIEGLVFSAQHPYTVRLNHLICSALGAKLIAVLSPGARSLQEINSQLEIATDNFGGHSLGLLIGCIFNKLNAPRDEQDQVKLNIASDEAEAKEAHSVAALRSLPIFNKEFRFLGAVGWNENLYAPRVLDLCRHLSAEVFNGEHELQRRIRSVSFCAREIHNVIPVMKPGALLVVSSDRSSVIVAVCLAALNGTRLGALLLTNDYELDSAVLKLCEQAFSTGLPVLKVKTDTWTTAVNLQSFNQEIPTDDVQRISEMMDHTAASIEDECVRSVTLIQDVERKLSPPAFRYKLAQLAHKANKRIMLPEGNEPRTIAAAAACAERGIAQCVLLGNRAEIERVALSRHIELGDGITIVDPDDIRAKYVPALVKMRGHKGVTDVIAEKMLHDNNLLGTVMLQLDEVDGLVSGAVNTTSNTIRPALQVVKTAPGASLVSSVFFMLLPDQVLVYGDCAINPDPNAEQLADIAIQSADSARAFGIEPRVAMISYSTGNSGVGEDVDKVKTATRIAQEKRPDLVIDGPLQYDAAVMESVASTKAPDSPVAGKATVLIFPDLNTGNTTYKAVQRSAKLVSIGPILQGLNKPVNDLSRGALVDDIVYTIALTAIQAAAKN